MINQRGQIAAFTIMELVITISLTSVVVATTYLAFNVINKSFLNHKQQNDITYEANQLLTFIHHDFSRAQMIYYTDENSLTLEFEESDVHYRFDEDFFLRHELQTNDTFSTPTQHLAVYFQHDSLLPPGSIVDEIYFQLKVIDTWCTYRFIKDYDMHTLMQFEHGRN